MDLAIGTDIIREMKHQYPHLVDPYAQNSINAMFKQPEPLPAIIKSGERILAAAALEVQIPHGYIGIIGLRSTWARLGLLAPETVADPGFFGSLTMELFNSSFHALRLRPGDYIWHIILVAAPYEKPYNGHYQGQQGITLPKPLQRGHNDVAEHHLSLHRYLNQTKEPPNGEA